MNISFRSYICDTQVFVNFLCPINEPTFKIKHREFEKIMVFLFDFSFLPALHFFCCTLEHSSELYFSRITFGSDPGAAYYAFIRNNFLLCVPYPYIPSTLIRGSCGRMVMGVALQWESQGLNSTYFQSHGKVFLATHLTPSASDVCHINVWMYLKVYIE